MYHSELTLSASTLTPVAPLFQDFTIDGRVWDDDAQEDIEEGNASDAYRDSLLHVGGEDLFSRDARRTSCFLAGWSAVDCTFVVAHDRSIARWLVAAHARSIDFFFCYVEGCLPNKGSDIKYRIGGGDPTKTKTGQSHATRGAPFSL